MTRPWRVRWREWAVSSPSMLWLLVFFAVPTVVIFAISFKPSNIYGGIGAGWTLDTLREIAQPSYPRIVARTLVLSALNTVVCLLLALPVGYAIARAPAARRQVLLWLVIVPFWTSFLARVFAWRVLLHPEGPLKHTLAALHLVRPNATLLNNDGAVLLVMVYTSLPFAILPIYAAAEKFDFRLVEAARDLGAKPLRAFWSIFLPGIRRGVLTAFLMVLIPSLGAYVIPDLVGGTHSEMIGTKIAQRVFNDRNLPHASALSALLALAVMVPLALVVLTRKRRQAAPAEEPGV